jgi:ATP adenylyltransferase
MSHLWTPWRMTYLRGQEPRPEGCLFCAKPGEEDAAAHIVHRGRRCYVILNRFPYNNGHFMAVPYVHVSSLEDLDAPTLTEILLLLTRGMAALRALMHPDGFNVGANLGVVAGAGIEDHVHFHAVPRWAGDTNFMPVIGDMRVVPQTWLQTYDDLKAALEDTA